MAQIVLVRHGQTDWNKADRFRGQTDIPLNATGLLQAERAGEAIKARFQVAALYTSPLSRARMTAEAIGRITGVPVEPLPALIDPSFGEWEGRSREEVRVTNPEQLRLWTTRPDLARIPGGESLPRVRRRAAAAVERIAAAHPEETVVLVSHRMVCNVLACYLLGLPSAHVWRVELDTASLSVFQKRRTTWVTTMLNETCHLRQ